MNCTICGQSVPEGYRQGKLVTTHVVCPPSSKTQTQKAVLLIKALLETISEEPSGVPSGILYMFWMTQGGTLSAYQTMMANLTEAGWLRHSNNQYFITPKGQELVQKLVVTQ